MCQNLVSATSSSSDRTLSSRSNSFSSQPSVIATLSFSIATLSFSETLPFNQHLVSAKSTSKQCHYLVIRSIIRSSNITFTETIYMNCHMYYTCTFMSCVLELVLVILLIFMNPTIYLMRFIPILDA